MNLTVQYVGEKGTLCKGCGALIAAYKPHVAEKEYVDLILKMRERDGSFTSHSTPMCRECAETVTVAQAGDLYLIDLAAWGQQNSSNGRADVRAWLLRQLDRIPVEVLCVR